MMKEEFKHQELGAGYGHSDVNADLAALKSDKRGKKKSGIQNLKMRSLCIAAYLRCLHAALEYAPSD